MKLDRLTPATEFKINAPMWGGGKKVVGLAENRIGQHNIIEFTYRRKSDGELSIPDKYYFSASQMAGVDFERQNIKGLTLVLIPFSNLEIFEGRE